jgi:hypothetical protein
MDDVAHIRSALAEAARAAWTDLRADRPGDRFYYYGLWTSPVAHRPAPTACSEEGLRSAVAAWASDGTVADGDGLRWVVNASPYDLAGDAAFARLEPLFEELGHPYERSREVNAALLAAMEGALADLDADGFFGRGAARDAVVLNVTMPAHEHPLEALDSARRLNPPAALVRYAADLAGAAARRPARVPPPTT